MFKELDLESDVIDLRDIIARVEELEDELQSEYQAYSESEDDPMEYDDWEYGGDSEEIQEYKELKKILDELKGCGGDEEWRGDWYPITLIADRYWIDYVEDLVSEIGDLPRDLPSYLVIDWEATANIIQQDYSNLTIGDEDYWYR